MASFIIKSSRDMDWTRVNVRDEDEAWAIASDAYKDEPAGTRILVVPCPEEE